VSLSEPSFRLKVARAEAHIEEVERAVADYFGSEPFEHYAVELSGKRSRYEHRLRILRQPPASIALITGDAIHNLRAALDHLAWELVKASGRHPSRQTEFPIGRDERRYRQAREQKTSGMRPEMLDILDRLQPYAGGNDALYDVHNLDIIDKHRLVLTAYPRMRYTLVDLRRLELSVDQEGTIYFNSESLHGKEIPLQGDVVLHRSDVDAKTERYCDPTLGLADATVTDGTDLVAALKHLADVVSDVADRFDRFLK
jgi:hypothetical protein